MFRIDHGTIEHTIVSGGGASTVFERTLATSAKNRLKDSASIAEFAGTRPAKQNIDM